MYTIRRSRKLLLGSVATVTAVWGANSLIKKSRDSDILYSDVSVSTIKKSSVDIPSRADLLSRLSKTDKFDVLIIGGGATGTGCALDAATRGLNVALVEMNDFASGTSSKSTKMAHGGVRYLEKAFWELSKASITRSN